MQYGNVCTFSLAVIHISMTSLVTTEAKCLPTGELQVWSKLTFHRTICSSRGYMIYSCVRSYLEYSRICAQALKKCLKPEVLAAAPSLEESTIKATRWEEGKPKTPSKCSKRTRTNYNEALSLDKLLLSFFVRRCANKWGRDTEVAIFPDIAQSACMHLWSCGNK